MLCFNQIYLEKGKNLQSFKNFLIRENVNEEVDNFILVKSSPSQHPSFELNEILFSLKIQAKNQFVIGQNCTTILNAILVSQALNKFNESKTVLYMCDSFSEYIDNELVQLKPSVKNWRNYSSGIVFSGNGKIQLEIISNNSKSENSLYSLAYFKYSRNGWKIRLNENSIKEFRKIDLENEICVINRTLSDANLEANELNALITTNRESQRTELLKDQLKIKPNIFYSSRNKIGHTGGSDILFNLNEVLKNCSEDVLNVLISANGIGYTWSSMVIKIKTNLNNVPKS